MHRTLDEWGRRKRSRKQENHQNPHKKITPHHPYKQNHIKEDVEKRAKVEEKSGVLNESWQCGNEVIEGKVC